MFGIGTPELLVIAILALVVVGPQRLPELGRTIGRALREFRKVQDEVRGMVQSGIGDDLADVRNELRGTADELKRTSKEITGGVKEAANVKPLLPSTKRPRPMPSAASRSGDASPAAAAGTADPTPPPASEPEAPSAPDAGAASPD